MPDLRRQPPSLQRSLSSPGGPLRATRRKLLTLSTPAEAGRAPHPSRGPAALPRPVPVAAASQAGLVNTHGDPGPRAAAAEGTSDPGRPAGAERQAKGRGPGRADEVA